MSIYFIETETQDWHDETYGRHIYAISILFILESLIICRKGIHNTRRIYRIREISMKRELVILTIGSAK